MTDNQPADREAPASPTTDQAPATGWRSALMPSTKPDDASGDAEALETSDDGSEGADSDGDGEDGSEEKTAARQPAIPEDPNGYVLPEIEGHQWSEADAPILESFFARAHAASMPQEAVNEIVSWYTAESAKQAEANAEARRERDTADKNAVVSALKKSLGEDGYMPAVQSLKQLFGDTGVFPKGVGGKIAGARLPDGRLLINEPSIAKFFVNSARSRYAAGGERDVEVDAKTRVAEIEAIRDKDIDEYFAKGLDKELIELTRKKG